MPSCKGNCRGAAPARYEGQTSASGPRHLPRPLAISDKNSRSPPCRARKQAAACTSWAARLSFSVYRVASILASSCSQEVLLVETPARCSACPSQPSGSAGSRCSHPVSPSGGARAYARSPQPLNLSCLGTGSSSVTAGSQLGTLPVLRAFQLKLGKVGLGKAIHVPPPSCKMKGFKLQVPGWAYALLELC